MVLSSPWVTDYIFENPREKTKYISVAAGQPAEITASSP
jgi:hypothetical protein